MPDHHHTGTCGHNHAHSHAHSHTPASFHKAFFVGITLNTAFTLVELFYGFHANSLALIGDAVHNFGDVLGLVVAWIGYVLSSKRATGRFTFGFGRMSIFATVFNGLFLVISSIWIIIEAFERLAAPQIPATTIVAIIAAIGIVINMGTALALQRGQHDSNIKGVWLHMIGDAAISAAVVLGALAIHFTGQVWIDPLLSCALALFILYASAPLLWEGLRLTLDGVPHSININDIRLFIEGQPGILSVANLHIWAISTTKTVLSAHIVIAEGSDAASMVQELQLQLKHRFGLASITLQLEQSHQHCVPFH